MGFFVKYFIDSLGLLFIGFICLKPFSDDDMLADRTVTV